MENGYTVHSFDAPSHGFSSKGSTSLFDFSALVETFIKKHDIKLVVSHSFGGVATTHALFHNPDLHIYKYVLITTPDRFTERINDVSELIGINDNIKKRVADRLKKENGVGVETLNVSDYVKAINVKKALIIHDKDDRVIPIIRAKNVHKSWSISEFMEIEGTGHSRILRTKEVR